MKVKDRVIEIMESEGMDTGNRTLVLDMCLVYLQAQTDHIKDQLKRIKK